MNSMVSSANGLSVNGHSASSRPEESLIARFEEAGLRMIERRFDPGSLIFSPETPVEQLYFLLSGVVRLYKTYGAYKESTMEMLKDRGAFGQFVPSNGRRVNGFAEAVTEVRAVGVRRDEIMRLITRQPDFAPALFAVLSERLQQFENTAQCLRFRQVGGRLASVLATLCESFGEEYDGTGAVKLDLRLTHQDLADMIASTREAISKKMGEFQRERLVEVGEGRKLAILDRQALLEYVGARC